MPVIPEEVLLGFISRSIQLSVDLLPRLHPLGSQTVSPEILKRYSDLVAEIHRQKSNDSVLSDESWEWIWEVRKNLNHLQLYGRLAWLNYNLFDLL